jgi:predicted AlkP superfamily phosphohydrolase/phosphomutase
VIAVLQFDCVSLPHFQRFLDEGRLPAFARLRGRGHWLPLETPALQWEGATYFTLYSGKDVNEHGVYFPFLWSAADQRVRPQDDYPIPEAIWERLAKGGKRSLVIDPYEGKSPKAMKGKALCGWQFKHKVTLRRWSVPQGLDRELERRFGGPSLVEEVYGQPSVSYLARMRDRLLAAPRRAADLAAALLAEERFDLVWITLSSSHIAGHWFLDPSRLPQDYPSPRVKAEIDGTLGDAYAAVDQALSDILASLPRETDLMVISPSSMGHSASRTHLLPGMLQAVLSEKGVEKSATKAGGSSLWRLRAAIPPDFRAWVARILPDHWAMQITARLEMRGVDWTKTQAFMVPSGDCGYLRLNLSGRERDGIVDPKNADQILDHIASGLLTFRDPDGGPAVKNVECVSRSLKERVPSNPFPDLIVHWSDRLPPHLAGVNSPEFGDVPSSGWGSGRTGEHRDEAWALVIPGSSKMTTPVKPPHIMDIASTVCAVLGVDREGLHGQPLMEGNPHMREDDGATGETKGYK